MTKNLLLLITAITISLFAVSQAPLYAATSINPKNKNHQSTVALTNAAPLSINDCTLSTSIDTIIGWHTGDFTATFTDTICSPNTKRFFIAENRNNTNQIANTSKGFLSLDFNVPDVNYVGTVKKGTWNVINNSLYQSDDNSVDALNTNIYLYIVQQTTASYLYTWQDKITGSQTGKRAGIHFVCDNGSKTNRGNSYLVRYNADSDKMQLYKSVNNTLQLKLEIPITVDTNVWYNHQVMYSPNTGKIIIFRNNQLVGSWIDTNPLINGSSLSFRSEKCKYTVDNVKVFRQRSNSQLITIGAQNNDLLYVLNDSYNPNNFYLFSTLVDETTCSNIDSMSIKVDVTFPTGTFLYIAIGYFNQISAIWSSSKDNQSGIANYSYSIGSTQGNTDVLDWTDNGLDTSFVNNNLLLTMGETYYVNVKITNGIGLEILATSYPVFIPSNNTCGIPTHLVITTINLLNASASWNSVADANSYIFRYRKVGTDVWNYITTDLPYQYIDSLSEGSQYEGQVAAVCSIDTSPFLGSVLFETPFVCSNPTNLTATNITSTSAYLSWNAINEAITYIIYGRKTGNNDWAILSSNTNHKQLNSTALHPCSSYEWAVAVQCLSGEQYYSNIESFTTTCPNPISSNTEFAKNNWQAEPQFSILPNPAQDLVYLTGSTNQDNALHIGIYSLTGQQLIEQYNNIEAGQINIPIQTNQLPKGYYLVEIDNGITKWHNKLVIIR